MNNDKLIVQTPPPRGLIDLGIGNPDFKFLPEVYLQQAAERAFAKGIRASLQYGTEQGNGYFRSALAEFLTDAYREKVDADSLFISAGSSAALDLFCTLYTKSGDTVFVEEPTYFLALKIFADHGLEVIPIPMDKGGLSTDALDGMLAKYQPGFLYTIPTFQNPSGCTLSQERREALIALAEAHHFFIVADEVYHFLAYTEEEIPKPFALFTRETDKVISINSFSKTLAPGLRLGWVQADQSILERLTTCGLLDSGGGMSPFTSAIVFEMLKAGDLTKTIEDFKQIYSSRLAAMDEALKQWLPFARYTPPQGGFFYWVRIPGRETTSLRPHAREFNVDFRQGALFSATRAMREYMRLCFTFYQPNLIEEGVKRLSQSLA